MIVASSQGNRRAPARKTTTSRRGAATRGKKADAQPPTLSRAHFQGFVAGVFAGVVIAVLGYDYWLDRSNTGESVAKVVPAEVITAEEETGPRFDFYTVLPSQKLDVVGDVTREAARNSQEAAISSNSRYILQAGSFRDPRDADRRRGELALLGLSASIEKTVSDNGTWHRVYIGPFDNRSQMANARSLTAQQAIDTLLLKRTIER
ncbi:sporulation and cell division repeat protein [Luminiphilus syltensis NOR5-1B]|uniref:Sporulation and cell division repeat protein n=1 Tax=Luminiphilus syltensis NOR5-1B TaxID=565045 RepID=B8KUS8_9GAMM|nr:sporulation and cell division repeat protein [Luminiphilus syltensis NOR5-1B]